MVLSPPAGIGDRLRALALVLLAWLVLGPDAATAADPRLHLLREARRSVHRALQLDPAKADQPALFGLLVIPVDFSDARLAAGWDEDLDLSGRLWGREGQSLTHYYRVASGGKLDLRITLAPVVNLPGTRRDYSDLGYNGYSRTRALATEALEAVKALGLEFRSLDMEGPDRIPGSSDDDGELDGVLILHAGPGQENGGLVQPLQFFLEEPVVSGGIRASFYAVASLQSGPGIWAHETGHLLGMEDRYDPLLHPDAQGADVRSLGGLGRFSLMASGAWGTGEGWNPALPDAYTCLQLGWYRQIDLPTSEGATDTLNAALSGGGVARVWTAGQEGQEFFLLETRDPGSTAPFDAGIPADQLLVYHVDESVPEGNWISDGPGQYHLRVRLVEADNDGRLAAGLDDGGGEDLFPGALQVDAFGPGTLPSSWGYAGNSLVQLTDIVSLSGGVAFTGLTSDEPVLRFTYGFSGSPEAALDLEVRSLGTAPGQLTCRLTTDGLPVWGEFQGGHDEVLFDLVPTAPGRWTLPEDIFFLLDPLPVPGAETTFTFTFWAPDWAGVTETRRWVWSSGPLDFTGGEWPGTWDIQQENPGATWHRWQGPPYLDGRQEPVLAATGENFTSAADFPDVHYGNSAWTALLSPPLDDTVAAVRLVHAMGAERLTPAVAMDGGRALWVGPDGRTLPAIPVDGYPHQVNAGAVNPLAGQPVFADTLLVDPLAVRPVWQVDVLPLPEETGPWRLKLEFAANTLWRREGWFVADLRDLEAMVADRAYPLAWDRRDGLTWSWPHDDLPAVYHQVQVRREAGAGWSDLGGMVTGTNLAAQVVLAALDTHLSTRHELRVVAATELGAIASRPVVIYPDGGFHPELVLGLPRPNPARGRISFRISVEQGNTASLGIYDVRGRLVHRRPCPPGDRLMAWDGTVAGGGRAPAGVYFLRLEGSGPVQTRKVVFLP